MLQTYKAIPMCSCPECYQRRRAAIAEPCTVTASSTDGKERVYKTQRTLFEARIDQGNIVRPSQITPTTRGSYGS